MNKQLFEHVDVRLWNTHVLNGKAANPAIECAAFEQQELVIILLSSILTKYHRFWPLEVLICGSLALE